MEKIDIPISYFFEIQNQTSKYTGVSWNQHCKKWQAQLKHNKKLYYGGLFDNEEHAAMGVNLLCLKFGIKRKNLRINMNNDANQQVIHSLSFVYIENYRTCFKSSFVLKGFPQKQCFFFKNA